MPRLAPSAALVLAALVARDARAGRPARAEAFWAGLDPAAATVPARGVVAVRVPPSGRVHVPGGRFVMGSTPAAMARAMTMCRREILGIECDSPGFTMLIRSEGQAHEVRLSPFLIDRTEVTVGDYDRCVAVGACSPPSFPRGDARFDRPTLPVTQVRWEDAAAYCAWAGGRLPTEAEWEYAARGPESREFPWGTFYNSHVANHGSFSTDETDATDGYLGLAPVGSFPDGATPLGLLDMAGNVAEWVDEVFTTDDEGYGYPAAPQVDPKGKRSGGFHVVRGGSYAEGAPWMRGASRSVVMSTRAPSVGFRCAADVAP